LSFLVNFWGSIDHNATIIVTHYVIFHPNFNHT